MTGSGNDGYQTLTRDVDAIVGAWLAEPTPANDRRLREFFRTVTPIDVLDRDVWTVLTWPDLQRMIRLLAEELSVAMGYPSVSALSYAMGFNMTDPNLSPLAFRSAIVTVILPFIRRHAPEKVAS